MAIISEKQDLSSWIPFFEPNSSLNAADRALYSSIFQNSVLAGYRNSELVPYVLLNDPTDQALTLSLSECGKTAGALLAARERERVELHKEQSTLAEYQKKISLLRQAALDQLELSKESLLNRIKERAMLTLPERPPFPNPIFPWTNVQINFFIQLGEFDRAQHLRSHLQAFQGDLSFFEKKADEKRKNLPNQELQAFSLELALQEINPARGIEGAGKLLRSRVESLRSSNLQLAKKNEKGSAKQAEELTSRKKTHALFFKQISIHFEELQQTTSQTLPSWTRQALSSVPVRLFPTQEFATVERTLAIEIVRGMVLESCSAPYVQGVASCQHTFDLLCNDIVRLAKEADLFTGNS